MYEKLKNYIQANPSLLHDLVLVLMLFLLFLLCRTTTDGNAVNADIQSIKQSVNGAGQSIGNAVKQNEDAKNDITAASQGIDRVSDRISTSKGQAESISNEIDELTGIIEQCRERNLRIKSILDQTAK